MAAIAGLRYEYSRFFVRPRAAVELILQNRDEMMHNLVITKPGARMKVVMQAARLGANAAKLNFIPRSAEVLWSIDVIKPATEKTLRFTAPAIPGDYPYVCTYPGHGFVMFGTMVVHTGKPRPPIKSKPGDNMQALAHGTATTTAGSGLHGGVARNGAPAVTLKRMFMPFAGPASIAVSHPGNLSYCFDAGACRLRYTWAGGPITKVKLRTVPSLTGPIVYREPGGFPLRFGSRPTQEPERIRFRGYRLDRTGSPEFEYEADGIVVHERITPHRDRIERRFRFGAGVGTVWFAFAGEKPPRAVPTGRLQRGTGDAPSYLGCTLAADQTLSLTFDLAGSASKGVKR